MSVYCCTDTTLYISCLIGALTGKGRILYGDLTILVCIVSRLPQGIQFKQPKQYTSSELRRVYDNIDSIKFVAISSLKTVFPDIGKEETVVNRLREEECSEEVGAIPRST